MYMTEGLIKELERAVAKAEAADYTVKYDILHTACKRVIRTLSAKAYPVENWKDGSYKAETQTKI